jgi:hypothetical protein
LRCELFARGVRPPPPRRFNILRLAPPPGSKVPMTHSCFGGDFGDDAVTLARAAAWRREIRSLLRGRPSSSTAYRTRPGGAVKKETLRALELSSDYRHECGICDRNYMLRRGCPCCRDYR